MEGIFFIDFRSWIILPLLDTAHNFFPCRHVKHIKIRWRCEILSFEIDKYKQIALLPNPFYLRP